MKLSRYLLMLPLLLLPAGAHAEPESYYQQKWCDEKGGETEVTLYDRTRVDCLLPDLAVEIDFSHKWAESVGQSLYYAELTDRDPGVLLIVEDGDARFLARWHNAADGLGIRLFVIEK